MPSLDLILSNNTHIPNQLRTRNDNPPSSWNLHSGLRNLIGCLLFNLGVFSSRWPRWVTFVWIAYSGAFNAGSKLDKKPRRVHSLFVQNVKESECRWTHDVNNTWRGDGSPNAGKVRLSCSLKFLTCENVQYWRIPDFPCFFHAANTSYDLYTQTSAVYHR